MPDPKSNDKPDWKQHGIRIVRSGELDSNTPQTPGMTRAEAISHARVGAQKLWAGTVVVHPDAKTGPHHHGELVIGSEVRVVVREIGEGRARQQIRHLPAHEERAVAEAIERHLERRRGGADVLHDERRDPAVAAAEHLRDVR